MQGVAFTLIAIVSLKVRWPAWKGALSPVSRRINPLPPPQSTNIANSIRGDFPALAVLAAFAPGVLLSLIDLVAPTLILAITEMEQWDSPSTELNLLLSRMYISSTMNVILTATTFAILADPFLLYDQPVIRTNLGIEYSGQFPCRLDEVRPI